MASEVSAMPAVNGYGNHAGYTGLEQQAVGGYGTPDATSMYQHQARVDHAPQAPSQPEIPKDEVGWYFVEQYYTTLSRNPEKLYLFYNKRSQFVSGQETDKVPVCVGQRAINDRIKELDYHDCKVRVTNVDSQASDQNIVIQVIGEISNRSQPHKKFTQTFVLATQTNGYFVLNDIFRYLIDEEEEEEPEPEPEQPSEAPASTERTEEIQQIPAPETGYQEPPGTAEEAEPKTLTSSLDPRAVEHDAAVVDRELEEKVLKHEQPSAPAQTDGESAAETEKAAPAEDAAVAESGKPEQSAAEESQPAESEPLDAEKPQDPTPSPAPTPSQQAPPPQQPAAAPKPAAPKTWASLAASANRVATPVTPVTPAVSSQPRAAPASRPQPSQAQAQAQAPSPAPTPSQTPSAPPASSTTPSAPSAPAAQRDEQASAEQDEWTAVGGGHNRQQSRQAHSVAQEPQSQTRGYIKNVHEGINYNDLEARMKQFGELTYFDISRQKNSAFVDFKTPEAYQAAVAANPHQIGNDKLYVVERYSRTGATPFVPNRGPYNANRGRGDFRGGRGGFPPRGRGAPRGGGGAGASRGGAPTA